MSQRLKKAQDRQAELHRQMTAFLDSKDASGADWTDEETNTYDGWKAEREKVQATIDRETDLQAAEKRLGTRRDVNQDTPEEEAARNPDRLPAQAKAAPDKMAGFSSPREFIVSVMRAGQGHRPDPRLKPLATVGSDEHSTFDDSHGGYFVPVGMSPNLLQVAAEADPMASAVTRIPMAVPRVEIHARTDKNHSTSVSGGLRVYRREEAGAATSSQISTEKVALNAHMLMGLAYETEELITDSPQSFAAIIAAGFRDEFTAKLIDERINGTGAGQFMGVLNSPCTISVAKETGQAAATIVYNNIIKMYSRLWGKDRGIWIANHSVIPQLAQLNMSVGTGGTPLWVFSAVSGVPSTLLGLPIFFSEFPAALGTVGDLILGNWSQYLEGTLEGVQQAESIHVRFVNHERTFKFWTRNDGAPWWRSALTPKRGDTLSPFVTLATRA